MKSTLAIILIFFIAFNQPTRIDGIWIPEKLNWPSKTSPYYKTKAFRTYIFKNNSVFIFVSTQRKHNYKNNVTDSLVFEGEPGYELYRGNYKMKGDSIFLNYQRIVSSSQTPRQCFFEEIIKMDGSKLMIENTGYRMTFMYDAHSIWDMQDYINLVKDSSSCVNCKCP